MERYQVTGNEYLSFPTVRESDGAAEGLTFLYMTAKGMIELRGGDAPFLRPVIEAGGLTVPLTELRWERLNDWIPAFTAKAGLLEVRGALLCPVGRRGFIYRLSVHNPAETRAEGTAALYGSWQKTLHEVNEAKPVAASLHLIQSNWNHSFVIEARSAFPLFAFAPILEDGMVVRAEQRADGGVDFRLEQSFALEAGQLRTATFLFGIGFEEVAAATAAKELLREGYDALYRETLGWLQSRARNIGDPYLQTMCNTNMFFSFFFASGRTLDTEELVLMTSRSPRYYVSCAYWDRDSLLWSFPAILMADRVYAREIMLHVFTRQMKNVGVHSRFIDGTVLEPGFELDELCAPMIALETYLRQTGDEAFFHAPEIQTGILKILAMLETKKHPIIDLYKTSLMPTDDVAVYPYLTYDNVLVWKVLRDQGNRTQSEELLERAKRVKQAIMEHCVKETNGTRYFCWSTDLNGTFDVYDEPPGSLLLLPYLGFCGADDPVYLATAAKIHDPSYPYSFAGKPIAEIGCEHAPHPWVLSVANSLLSGSRDTAIRHLQKMRMDNGIACESVYEDTGECATGEAFATCAGFLAYAIDYAMSGRFSTQDCP